MYRFVQTISTVDVSVRVDGIGDGNGDGDVRSARRRKARFVQSG